MATMKMTTEEAFVKVLQMHGIEHAFGIIGSAMMPISDLFPKAGIKFWDVAHECNGGMMADGFTRASGKMSMMVAQNGLPLDDNVQTFVGPHWGAVTPFALPAGGGPLPIDPGPPPELGDVIPVHRSAQNGRGSGYDVATALHGGVCLYDTSDTVIRARNVPWPDGR